MHLCSYVTEDTKNSSVSGVGWCPPAPGEGGMNVAALITAVLMELRAAASAQTEGNQNPSYYEEKAAVRLQKETAASVSGSSSRRTGIMVCLGKLCWEKSPK